jgi:soluble lytic murein transglycosylase-like protein
VSNDIDFDLMLALIEQESEFDKYSTSPTGDYGLCQINLQSNAELIEKKQIYNIYDEYYNIDCAITILSELQDKYEDIDCVLMSYNMGEDGARKLWNQGIWETKYSLSVKQKMNHYKKFMKRLNKNYKQ